MRVLVQVVHLCIRKWNQSVLFTFNLVCKKALKKFDTSVTDSRRLLTTEESA
jgi:hypothetical protein